MIESPKPMHCIATISIHAHPAKPPANMDTFPTDVAARSVRATLSRAVDHVPCARATPNAAEHITIVTATATGSSQRMLPESQDTALTGRMRTRVCAGDETMVAAWKGQQADMIDVT